MNTYFNNHNHTTDSNLRLVDCITAPEQLIDKAIDMGLMGIAITDHEVLSAHKNIFVVCLTVNLVLELTIMILLHCFIPKKLLTTNTKVGLFIYFLD